MRTTNSGAGRVLLVIFSIATVVMLSPILMVASSVAAEGSCGPRGGLGKPGCGPPSPNQAPVVIGANRSAAVQRTAVTIIVDRGESSQGLIPGDGGRPGGVNIFISTDSQPGRRTTPEDSGYFLFMQNPMPDGGRLLIYQRVDQQQPNPASRLDPFAELRVLLVPVAAQPPTAPNTPQIRAWRTTRVDVMYEGRQAAVDLLRRVALPGLELHANPAAGLTNLPSWFWATVGQGQLDPAGSLTVPYPWETTWQEEVQVCTSRQVPDTNPPVIDRQCGMEWQDRRENGTDYASISVQLSAASFSWFFGDDRYDTFGRAAGLGLASRDINNPSPVRHTYTRSSLDQLSDGGYRVQLYATWSATYSITTSTGQSEGFTIPVARSNIYELHHEVRESQAIVGRAPRQ